jgi:hypothetical protein
LRRLINNPKFLDTAALVVRQGLQALVQVSRRIIFKVPRMHARAREVVIIDVVKLSLSALFVEETATTTTTTA